MIKRQKIDFSGEVMRTEGLTVGGPDQAAVAFEGAVTLETEIEPSYENVNIVDLPEAVEGRDERAVEVQVVPSSDPSPSGHAGIPSSTKMRG